MSNENSKIITEVIANTHGYKIVYYRQLEKTQKLIITFDAHGHDLRDKGFGSDMLINSGYDHIFVSHALNSQYQLLSIADFFYAVGSIAANYNTYTYGSSLGGYCAVYYAGCIGAQAIAISPRNSAHPSVGNPFFANLLFTHNNIIQNPRSQLRPIIIYDPKQETDVSFIDDYIVPAYPNAVLFEMAYAGHLIAEALLEVGQIKRFAVSIIEEGTVPNIDLNISNSSYWSAEKAYFELGQNNFTSAAKYFKASLQIRHNETHLDRLISLVQKRKAHYSVLYGVIDPYIELLNGNPLFDPKWYLEKYQDLADDSGVSANPALHYLLFGASEGRDPSINFDTNFYLGTYPDVSQEGMNPLVHYIKYGSAERRRIKNNLY
jgi:hypothetical protein